MGTEKEFLDLFQKLCYSRQRWQVWADLMKAWACSISNATDRNPEHFDRREKEYSQCIERLGGVEIPARLLSVVTLALEADPNQDFLGRIYMNLDLGSHWHGQFFTPYDVCVAMAKITIDGNIEQMRNKPYISISDPACGAGATLIAGINELRRRGINYQTEAVFMAQDIDEVAALMCYVQMSLIGAPGYVCVGNTLTNPCTGPSVLRPIEREGQELWFTPMYFAEKWNSLRKMEYVRGVLKMLEPKKKTATFTFYVGELDMGKTYAKGEDRLLDEKNKYIGIVAPGAPDAVKQQYELLFSALIEECQKDPALDTAVLKPEKTFGHYMMYCTNQAMKLTNPTAEQRQKARNGEEPISVPVTSEMLIGWARDYYMTDNLKEDKKEKPKTAKPKAEKPKAEEKAEKPKKDSKVLKMPKPDKPAVAKKDLYYKSGDLYWMVEKGTPMPTEDALKDAESITKAEYMKAKKPKEQEEKKEQKPKPKKKDEFDGQMSLFDFMGGGF